MIALLIAGGVAFTAAVLGTPLLIRVLRARGSATIRDDGPFTHPHVGGRPHGGIASSAASSWLPRAHVRTEHGSCPHRFDRCSRARLVIVGFSTTTGGAQPRNPGLRMRGDGWPPSWGRVRDPAPRVDAPTRLLHAPTSTGTWLWFARGGRRLRHRERRTSPTAWTACGGSATLVRGVHRDRFWQFRILRRT
jgi:hypothetical protein